MSKLIHSLIENLLQKNGAGLDDVILENLDIETSYDARLTQPNCLSSLFMLDVNKNPKYGFMRVFESYSDYKTRITIAKHTKNVEKLLGREEYKAYEKLYEDVLANIPDEHPVVQLLAFITMAKVSANMSKDSASIEAVVKLEKDLEAYVYLALQKNNPFKTQDEIQNRVLDYVKTYQDIAKYDVYDYLRRVATGNIISVHSNSNYANKNFDDAKAANSLVYIDPFGKQRYLINARDEVPALSFDINDLVKGSGLLNDEGLTGHSRYIQEALWKIRDKVEESAEKKNITLSDDEKFLQTAIAYLILLDKNGVEDPLDIIGISLANPISDIAQFTDKTRLKAIIESARDVAASVDGSVKDSYKTADELAAEAEKVEEARARTIEETKMPEETEANDAQDEEIARLQAEIEELKKGSKIPAKNVPDENKKYIAYVNRNLKYYQTIVRKLIERLGEEATRFAMLEQYYALNADKYIDDDMTDEEKAQYRSNEKERQKYNKKYKSSEDIEETITKLSVSLLHMSELSKVMSEGIVRGKEKPDSAKIAKELHIAQEQMDAYIEYYAFVKSFSEANKSERSRLTTAHITKYLKEHGDGPLAQTLKFLGTSKIKPSNSNAKAKKAKQKEVVVVEQPAENVQPAEEPIAVKEIPAVPAEEPIAVKEVPAVPAEELSAPVEELAEEVSAETAQDMQAKVDKIINERYGKYLQDTKEAEALYARIKNGEVVDESTINKTLDKLKQNLYEADDIFYNPETPDDYEGYLAYKKVTDDITSIAEELLKHTTLQEQTPSEPENQQ